MPPQMESPEEIDLSEIGEDSATLAEQIARGDFVEDEGEPAASTAPSSAASVPTQAPAPAPAATPAPVAAPVAAPATSSVAATPAPSAEGATEGEADPAADDKGAGDKPVMIPKARFDQVNIRRQRAEEQVLTLEQEIARLQQTSRALLPQDENAKPLDVQDAERRYFEAVMEGNQEDALRIRGEINQAIELQAAQRIFSGQVAAVQQQNADALESVAEALLDNIPELENDPELLDEVMAMRDGYMARGVPAAAALQKAGQRLIARLDAGKQSDPPPPAAPNKGELRQQQQMKLNRATAAAAPPEITSAGVSNRLDSGSLDVGALSEKAFAALSEEDKARARGDYV